MKANFIETTDLFRGAFFLCMGSHLSKVRVRTDGKQIASFLFTGADLMQLDQTYIDGTALVNPVQYRESLNRLRDILFEKLRQHKRSTRYDRKRKNRSHQAWR